MPCTESAPAGAGSPLAQGARAPVRPGLPGGGHRLRSPAACMRERPCRNGPESTVIARAARSQRQSRPGLALVDLDAVHRSGADRRRQYPRPGRAGTGQAGPARWPPAALAGGLQARASLQKWLWVNRDRAGGACRASHDVRTQPATLAYTRPPGRCSPPASPISYCEHLHSFYAFARVLVVALRYGLVSPLQLQMCGLCAASPGREMEARAALARP